MFSGIITNIGTVEKRSKSTFVFGVNRQFLDRIKQGTSVSINGVCLTVTQKEEDTTFSVEVMPETQRKTMLGKLKKKDIVNLELPVTPKTFLSGHIVEGHIDTTGTVSSIKPEGNSRILTVKIPPEFTRYVVPKGSIAINGISLTVIDVKDGFLTVGIIPYTFTHTMLKKVGVGESVNIEVDVLAKYIEKLLKY